MKERKNVFVEKLLALLSQSGPMKASEIALQLGIKISKVRAAIQIQRKHFLNGKTHVRVTTGPEGYTLSQTRRNVTHETGLRIAQIAGNMFNGAPVFLRCKRIAARDFQQIQLKFEPKMIEFHKLTR